MEHLKDALVGLNPAQLEAAMVDGGAALVLAGPGAGKTRVLTVRVARLVASAPQERFRVLALTYTTKAADEMRKRVLDAVPGCEDRVSVGTFHSFCTQVLRQHGTHVGIPPDFRIVSQESERKDILREVLAGLNEAPDMSVLDSIDKLRARLAEPSAVSTFVRNAEASARIERAYSGYLASLKALKALDFTGMIYEAYWLLTRYPAIAKLYQRTHRYWLVDEFQDTTPAQYRFLAALAVGGFKNLFAVADDDQIIFEWNGASYRILERFRSDFEPVLLQLPTNYRCRPEIVEAANRLVRYNALRTAGKLPIVSGRRAETEASESRVRVLSFTSDHEEREWLARDILDRGISNENTAIIARTRAQLEFISESLVGQGILYHTAQRRDEFLSAEVTWLHASLRQIARPLDVRNATLMAQALSRAARVELAVDVVLASAATVSGGYLSEILDAAERLGINEEWRSILNHVRACAAAPNSYRHYVRIALDMFATWLTTTEASEEPGSDLADDIRAWRAITREIDHAAEGMSLYAYLQELDMRSKEPPVPHGALSLSTVHSAKGREFSNVYVTGLVEDLMPSFQARKKGPDSREMEEERRNCFVAITRAGDTLTLTFAATYRGWAKEPSRFLTEMELLPNGNRPPST